MRDTTSAQSLVEKIAGKRIPFTILTRKALACLGMSLFLTACGDDDVTPEPDASDLVNGEVDLVPDDSAADPTADVDMTGDGVDTDTGDSTASDPRYDWDPESTECPPPPNDLPSIEVTGSGRFRRIADVPYPDLLDRDVTIYLPVTYDSQADRRYPVLYMHDGQNLFDNASAAFGVEWRVDETIDALVAAEAIEEYIVVGIHNTNDRIAEYTPDVDATYGGGDGDRYADFLVGVLKPIIDSHFRTLCGRSNTALAGSSLGGLISLHVFMRYPEIFGLVGCVSSSFWWNDGHLLDDFDAYSGWLPVRLWIDGGSGEGDRDNRGVSSVIVDNRRARRIAMEHGLAMGESLGYLEDPNAVHNEAAWAGRLDSILWFLLADDPPAEMTPTDLSLFLYASSITAGGSTTSTSLALEALHGGNLRLTWPNEDAVLTSLDRDVATVSADGTVTGVSNGDATIRAELFDLTDEQVVHVVESTEADLLFEVTVPVGTPENATIYIVGNIPQLGSWDPGAVAMTPPDGSPYWTHELTIGIGTVIEYKCTRGSWATVEKDASGGEIGNRIWVVEGDATVHVTVESWADQ